MANNIKCPHCGKSFDSEAVLTADLTKSIEQQYQQRFNAEAENIEANKKQLELDQQAFEEKKKKENELFAQKLHQEKLKMEEHHQQEKVLMEVTMKQQIQKSVSGDFENKIKMLEQNAHETEERLKLSRQKELEFLQKEKAMKDKEADFEIQVQKKLKEERELIAADIRTQEKEKNVLKETESLMRLAELQKQIDDQKKLMEEMRRKSEQGSMQTQGEVQELLLEELLRASFPFDVISEVGKGVKGADCTLTVRNNLGQECGKIIFESKRTKEFSVDWIEKLKADMRSQNADIALLVTQVYPKEFERFGEKDGVWICNFYEVKAVVSVLRMGILKIFSATKSQENKGDKMHLLYNYLTSREFSDAWQAMREGFGSMRNSIQKERDAMERLWKSREKQLEKVLLNAAQLQGAIEGISGHDVKLNLLDDITEALED